MGTSKITTKLSPRQREARAPVPGRQSSHAPEPRQRDSEHQGREPKKIGSPEIAGLTQDQIPVRTLNPEAYNFKHGEQKIAGDISILE